jgi:solute carrier family 36 (proton-coupled amino acid transporter)
MKKVIIFGTIVAGLCYVLSGFFGFATFAMNPDATTILSTQNIFTAPYFNERFLVTSMFMLLAGVVLSTPLSVLPCKDTVEELVLGQSRLMTGNENFFCTLLLILKCFLIAILVPNIGDVLLVVGATSCPVVGFVLPVAYWLKVDKSEKYSF